MAPIGAVPLVGGLGTEAQEVVAIQRACAGDGTPHRRGPTTLGDRNSCPSGGNCPKSFCEGLRPPLVRSYQPWGRGILTMRGSLPKKRPRGIAAGIGMVLPAGGTRVPSRQRSLPKKVWRTAAPIGAGPAIGGTGSQAKAAVTVQRATEGDGSPNGHRPTGWGDGESCPSGRRCLNSACEGWQHPSARAQRLGG